MGLFPIHVILNLLGEMQRNAMGAIYPLIDGRHFSDVIDFWTRIGANIDFDHMLVVIKLMY
jgi:hypothetical protein